MPVMKVEQIKEALVGDWVSIAPEVRPSAGQNPDGTLKPFYLKREFKYLAGNRFELDIVNSAEPNGAVPIARIAIRGRMIWRGPHAIAAGAQKTDFVADEGNERSSTAVRAEALAEGASVALVDELTFHGAWRSRHREAQKNRPTCAARPTPRRRGGARQRRRSERTFGRTSLPVPERLEMCCPGRKSSALTAAPAQ
jgi:hypothetical protein